MELKKETKSMKSSTNAINVFLVNNVVEPSCWFILFTP